MQIYDMVSGRMFSQIRRIPIWYENFEQKSAAYTPVFTAFHLTLLILYSDHLFISMSTWLVLL